MKEKRYILAALMFLSGICLVAQEAIGSYEDQHYDFLALTREADRPYLNYKTLSDSDWDGPEMLRIYGPELYSSYNSAAPFGQNDGALWQGRGLNASLTGGIRFAALGFELTFKPQLTFSQNQAFDLMPSAYESEYGYIWGYGHGIGADAPQRFGNEALYGYSWGDSEIRYTWKTLTIGFGTQSPWLGPGRINAIIHSNNAPPYPKLDIGIRRTPVTIKGIYLGDVEARLWGGYLSESDFFDSNESNDHNLISALALAYAPSFLPGLSVFANRSYLAPWIVDSLDSIPSLLFIDLKGGGAQDVWDQRASLGFDYLLPAAGIEVYGEAGINDYGPSLDGYIRYPFHSMVYTGGLRKAVGLSRDASVRGELIFEWTNLELSQDFQFQWPATFYMHHQIIQGYTNGGQWLGAGIGTGGNSQYLGFKMYYPRGSSLLYIQRVNPDNDYLYALSVGTTNDTETASRISDFKANLTFGTSTDYKLSKALLLSGGLALTVINNPLYDSLSWSDTRKKYNLTITSTIKYTY